MDTFGDSVEMMIACELHCVCVFCAVQSCKGGRVQQVEELIFYGADVNQQNAGGNTALHVCAANNQVCVCVCVVMFV